MMQVIQVRENSGPAEEGNGSEAIFDWSAVVGLIGQTNGEEPQA